MTEKYKKQAGHVPSSSRGFTLIETFVAITILVITVLGPMSLLSRALQDSRYIKDQMTASFLAQEGVELAIDDRNNNGDKYNQPAGPIDDLLYTCAQFYWHTGTGFSCSYSAGAIATNFSRIVLVDSYGLPANQYRITSYAYYKAGTTDKSVMSSTIIFAY